MDKEVMDSVDLVATLQQYSNELAKLFGGLEVRDEVADGREIEEEENDQLTVDEMASECLSLLNALGNCSLVGEEEQDSKSSPVPLTSKILMDAAEDDTTTKHHDNLELELQDFAAELHQLSSLLLIEPTTSPSEATCSTSTDNQPAKTNEAETRKFNHELTTAASHVETPFTATSLSTQCWSTTGTHRTPSIASSNSHKKKALCLKAAKRKRQFSDKTCALWKEHQRKSFQRHIARQQRARLETQLEKTTEEKLVAARFQGARYHSIGNPSTYTMSPLPPPPLFPKSLNETYLGRFYQERAKPLAAVTADSEPAQVHPIEDLPKLPARLCGVYLYGTKRKDSLTYITFSSILQLKERVRTRFAIAKVVSIYRERIIQSSLKTMMSPSQKMMRKTLQRVTSIEQVQNGDCLCVTRDSYEDMAILCEWMKRRQQQIYHFQPQTYESTKSTASPSAKLAPPLQEHPTAATSQSTVTNNGASYFSTMVAPTTRKLHQLWDVNGRSMAVKHQL